jgi:hypothetical protein
MIRLNILAAARRLAMSTIPCGAFAAAAFAQPGLTLAPGQAPPTTVVTVGGTGFAASEAVDADDNDIAHRHWRRRPPGLAIGRACRSRRLKRIPQCEAALARYCQTAAYSRFVEFAAVGRRASTPLMASPAPALRSRSAPSGMPSSWNRRQWTRVTALFAR